MFWGFSFPSKAFLWFWDFWIISKESCSVYIPPAAAKRSNAACDDPHVVEQESAPEALKLFQWKSKDQQQEGIPQSSGSLQSSKSKADMFLGLWEGFGGWDPRFCLGLKQNPGEENTRNKP